MSKLATMFIWLWILGVWALPVWADFQAGLEAYRKKDYATALKEWRPLAEKGDAKAQYNLGVLYHEGQGVRKNYGEAMKWYRLAASKGLAGAQVNLGNIYYVGHGVRQDYIQAFIWFALAADQGNEDAKRSRGEVLHKMTLTQIVEAEKQKLLKKAAHGL